MISYTKEQLQNRFKKLGYQWPKKLHLIGVRSKEDKPNAFDDKMYIFLDGICRAEYTCTTNPGSYWLQNFITLNKYGTAVLKPGQYIDSWAFGKHRGAYEALVQVKPVTVYRDYDKDLKSENLGKEQTGLFGINIHRANQNAISKLIDKWSAGCQVLNDPNQFAHLISTVKVFLPSQKFFTYTLLEEF